MSGIFLTISLAFWVYCLLYISTEIVTSVEYTYNSIIWKFKSYSGSFVNYNHM